MTGVYKIDFNNIPTDQLQSHDKMMIEATIKVKEFSHLSMQVWSAVLKELDKRGKVTLVSGSYDDIGNSLIHRL